MSILFSILGFIGRLFGLIPSTDRQLGREEVKNADLQAALKEKTSEAEAFKEPPRSKYDVSGAFDKLRDKSGY